MEKDKFDKLIEIAKKESKEDFLKFVTGIYGVDKEIFDHIWEVPVIAPYDGDSLVTTAFSSNNEDEILNIIDDFIADELGNSEGCFISLNKMQASFNTDEGFEKWLKNTKNNKTANYDEIKLQKKYEEFINSEFGKWTADLGYNAIIVYNESKLQKEYKDLIKENSKKTKPKTDRELEQIFKDYVKKIITHERCHLNANYLVTEVDKYFDKGLEKQELSSSEVNGASLTQIEQSNIITSKKDTSIINKYNQERNEAIVDTLSQMMSNYQEGDSVENCLYRIIKARNGKSQYSDIDDREVLTMYTLFPEELTEWATFGAYDFIRENKLQKMIINVCGTDMPLRHSQLKKKVEEYLTKLEKDTLSDMQKEMLEMLGFSISKKIDKKDMKETSTTETALGAFSGSLQEAKLFMKSVQKEENIKEQ